MNKDYTPSKANQEKVRVTKQNKMKKQQNHKEREKTERKENDE
jgi:hypothetical protein